MTTETIPTDEQDARIRAALKQADKSKQLNVVAVVTGITGDELRKIMNSREALPPMVRAMLAIHL